MNRHGQSSVFFYFAIIKSGYPKSEKNETVSRCILHSNKASSILVSISTNFAYIFLLFIPFVHICELLTQLLFLPQNNFTPKPHPTALFYAANDLWCWNSRKFSNSHVVKHLSLLWNFDLQVVSSEEYNCPQQSYTHKITKTYRSLLYIRQSIGERKHCGTSIKGGVTSVRIDNARGWDSDVTAKKWKIRTTVKGDFVCLFFGRYCW